MFFSNKQVNFERQLSLVQGDLHDIKVEIRNHLKEPEVILQVPEAQQPIASQSASSKYAEQRCSKSKQPFLEPEQQQPSQSKSPKVHPQSTSFSIPSVNKNQQTNLSSSSTKSEKNNVDFLVSGMKKQLESESTNPSKIEGISLDPAEEIYPGSYFDNLDLSDESDEDDVIDNRPKNQKYAPVSPIYPIPQTTTSTTFSHLNQPKFTYSQSEFKDLQNQRQQPAFTEVPQRPQPFPHTSNFFPIPSNHPYQPYPYMFPQFNQPSQITPQYPLQKQFHSTMHFQAQPNNISPQTATSTPNHQQELLSQTEIIYLKNRSQDSLEYFAVLLMRKLFRREERRNRSVNGTDGKKNGVYMYKEKLDPMRVQFIKETVFKFFNVPVNHQKRSWADAVNRMNEYLRRKNLNKSDLE